MADFAQLDENNKVINLICVNDEDCLDALGNKSEEIGIVFCKNIFGAETNWVESSIKGAFRGLPAIINGSYLKDIDIFAPPQPFNSWNLNLQTGRWESPIPFPEDGKRYAWNESSLCWDAEVIPENQPISVGTQTA